MNRTALCIQMLHILYGRNEPISAKDLANQLETNVRNIYEFKKELETAGYVLVSIPGRYGGYKLDENSIFPSLALSEDEKKAINEAMRYLEVSHFPQERDFESAMNKVKAKTKHSQSEALFFYMQENERFSMDEKRMMSLAEQAKQAQRSVTFLYQSPKQEQFEERIVDPYELVINQDGCYLLGYDHTKNKKRTFKYFKIKDERMQKLCILSKSFSRDLDFKIQDHLSQYSIMKDLYECTLAFSGKGMHIAMEQKFENELDVHYEEGRYIVHFMMAGKERLIRHILSFGADCEVLAPEELRNEIKEEIASSLSHYDERLLTT